MTRVERGFVLTYAGREIRAAPGDRILEALLRAGIDHRHVCGGNGFCTSCRIEVRSGTENLSETSSIERQRLGELAGSVRLACQTRVFGPAVICVPVPISSRFSPFEDESED